MTKYKCGCKTSGVIILDDNELSFIAWDEWAHSVGVFGTKELCWHCWNAQKTNKIDRSKR